MKKDLVKKLAIALVLIVVLGYIGNIYILNPKRERIKKLDQDIKEVSFKIEKGKKALKRAKALAEEIARLEKKLEVMREVLPTKEEIPGLIREISKLGYYNRINYSLFQPGKEVVKADKGYAVISIKLRFNAFYPQLVSFLSGVAKMERLVKPVVLNVSYDVKKKKAVSENPRLRVRCTLETYRYVPFKQAKKGKKGGKK